MNSMYLLKLSPSNRKGLLIAKRPPPIHRNLPQCSLHIMGSRKDGSPARGGDPLESIEINSLVASVHARRLLAGWIQNSQNTSSSTSTSDFYHRRLSSTREAPSVPAKAIDIALIGFMQRDQVFSDFGTVSFEVLLGGSGASINIFFFRFCKFTLRSLNAISGFVPLIMKH
jgi:hypothetical protein